MFQEGRDLPCFAAFALLKDEAGTGFVFESAIRRAGAPWNWAWSCAVPCSAAAAARIIAGSPPSPGLA